MCKVHAIALTKSCGQKSQQWRRRFRCGKATCGCTGSTVIRCPRGGVLTGALAARDRTAAARVSHWVLHARGGVLTGTLAARDRAAAARVSR